MRAIWKGAVAFGLVNVPVKLYSATGQHEVSLHQVHREDAGRVRYRRVCSVCGNELTMADIDKGYETADGSMVVLTDEDLAALPLATEREIEVLEFVPGEQVDPILLDRTYYLEPERNAVKAYTLLREALESADRMAVVKVALRQRESMAVLRVRGDVICLQTLLWPDEVRAAEFPALETEVSVRPQELAMASSLIESMAGDFDPSDFEDSYATALDQMIEAKIASGSTVAPAAATAEAEPAAAGGEVVDLLAALQRSVESARAKNEPSAGARRAADDGGGRSEDAAAKPRTSAPRTARAKAEKDTETADTSPKAAGAKKTSRAAGGRGSNAAATAEPEAEEEPKKATSRRRAS